jgi:ureidoacrylate peracid hydrolase
LRLPSRDAALLVIDMQNGFVHEQSGMGKSANGTKAQRAIVPAIISLVEFCRSKKIPVIWSQQEHFPADVTRERKRLSPHSARQGFLPCLRGTWETALYEGIATSVKPEDHLVPKHRASVFYNTNLEGELRMFGTQTLLVAGCNTEFCVESTVRDAYARDFDVVVARDCVAGINPKFHAHSLEVFQAYFGEVLSSPELMETLE